MGLTEFDSGKVVHAANDSVESVEILLKGELSFVYGRKEVHLLPGSIIGFSKEPGENYGFDYKAVEKSMLYSYPHEGSDTLMKIMKVNKNIAPNIAEQAILNTRHIYGAYVDFVQAQAEAEALIRTQFDEYMSLAAKYHVKVRKFPALSELPEVPYDEVEEWKVSFMDSFMNADKKLTQEIFKIGTDMCTGLAYTCYELVDRLISFHSELIEFSEGLSNLTSDFIDAYTELKTRETTDEHASEIENSLLNGEMPDLSKTLDVILDYAKMPKVKKEVFVELFNSYKNNPDRMDTSDEMRKARRELTKYFFQIYEACFFRSITDKNIPVELKMFFYFGFADPELSGEKNTEYLFNQAINYEYELGDKILFVYDWLKLVLAGKVNPSRNEFDMDYPAFLRESKRSGEITEEEEKTLLKDNTQKVRFEIKNLFELGNRMTFGRISVYQPFFDSMNVMLPIDKSFMSKEDIENGLNFVRGLDYQIFYREDVYSNEDLDINQIVVHNEYLPYIILMPNAGTRSVLWQEIDGKKRSTSARFLCPVVNLEDHTDAIIKACGEFRWEMCKTEQGIHWNDLSDPSLTAEYNDYLQYYKKNKELNQETRDKIKKELQKAGNNFKRVFTDDYLTYLKFESKGAFRLNKVARTSLAKYCTFPSELRKTLLSNPHYTELLNRRNIKQSEKIRPLLGLQRRIEGKGLVAPNELVSEIEFLKK